MQYNFEIIIDLPREDVVALLDNPENIYKWQEGLVSFAPISGQYGQVGAKSKLVYKLFGRSVEMIETITTRNMPDEYSGTYESDGVFNVVKNRFYENGPDKTRWVTENKTQFSGSMRLLSKIISGAVRNQTRDLMINFKKFAESSSKSSAANASAVSPDSNQ